nr:hypothetical protein [Tanacetum cinerariifolium]
GPWVGPWGNIDGKILSKDGKPMIATRQLAKRDYNDDQFWSQNKNVASCSPPKSFVRVFNGDNSGSGGSHDSWRVLVEMRRCLVGDGGGVEEDVDGWMIVVVWMMAIVDSDGWPEYIPMEALENKGREKRRWPTTTFGHPLPKNSSHLPIDPIHHITPRHAPPTPPLTPLPPAPPWQPAPSWKQPPCHAPSSTAASHLLPNDTTPPPTGSRSLSAQVLCLISVMATLGDSCKLGGKKVTKSLQGDDGGACKVLGWLLGGVMEVLETLQVTDTGCRLFPVGAPFTQGMISSIPIGGSISPEGFLPSILLMVIMVTVVIVVVILVVVVIVGVVIVVAIIGNYALLPAPLISGLWVGIGIPPGQGILSESTSSNFHFAVLVDLTVDEDLIDEDGDTRVGDSEVLVSLGEISSGGKKSQESNIGDTKDGGKAVCRAIMGLRSLSAQVLCLISVTATIGDSCKLGGKEVTRSLQRDDRGACKVLGWLLGGVIEVIEVLGCLKCAGEVQPSIVGQLVVLPASFIGGPRDIRRRFLDAMTLVKDDGKPDIFLTMTCNPSWPEILEYLEPGQKAYDRPDVVARVFHAKLKDLKDQLFNKHIIGVFKAYVQYLYKDFPKYFTWNSSSRRWNHRKKGPMRGRLVSANPVEGERFYLRVLLSHVKGPTCWEDLYAVNDILYLIFRKAALERGLIESDDSLTHCLQEASIFQFSVALRRLFATILRFCEPGDCMGKSLNDFDLPSITATSNLESGGYREVEEEYSIVIDEEHLHARNSLNPDQKSAYDVIMRHVDDDYPGVFFIDGPGGTGKTFLYKPLLAQVHNSGLIVLAIASSGAAANNMVGGRTTHS